MSPLYSKNGNIVIGGDGKFANIPCPSGCCGREPPGICCNNEWHDTPFPQGECPADIVGVCCSGENAPNGIWVPTPSLPEDGVCCNGEYYPPEVGGDCCGSVWHSAIDPNSNCPEGQVFLKWGPNDACCGCLPEQIMDYRQDPSGVLVNTLSVQGELCCPGGILPDNNGECPGRCRIITYDELNNPTGCECENFTQTLCSSLGGTFQAGGDSTLGCEIPCCTEFADGSADCQMVNSSECVCPSEPAPCYNNCNDNVCLGACFDPNTLECNEVKFEACDKVWMGLGSVCDDIPLLESQIGTFRPPFSPLDGCETVMSKGAGLVLTQPKFKRMPPFNDTLRVTVTGTTQSAIRIHGTLIGAEDKGCDINHSFLICGDSFNIEPIPCGTNFRYLEVDVCWEQETTDDETLEFSGCNNITVYLGNCAYNCITKLLYNLNGHTSNAQIVFQGSGILEANGLGALVLTNNISPLVACNDTLLLQGSGVARNEISGIISGDNVNVYKKDTGTWVLSGDNSYTGQLQIFDGTLIVASGVDDLGTGPFGDSSAPKAIVGDSAAGATGTAKLLVDGGVLSGTGGSIDRTIIVAPLGSGASQVVVLGTTGVGDATFGTTATTIRLGRSVTLQASDSASARFVASWRDINNNFDPVVGYTIGSSGNAGVVEFRSELSHSATEIKIVNGTARIVFGDQPDFGFYQINSATPVVIGSHIGAATLDISGESAISQKLGNLSFVGSSGLITSNSSNGTLQLWADATAASVTVTGTNHLISLPTELLVDSTFDINTGGKLVVSGNITGTGGIVKNGSGTLELSGTIAYTGETDITAGTLIVNQEFAGSSDISKVTFTPTTLTVVFTTSPTSGSTYQLLGGATAQTYNTVALTGAGGATGSYNSANSTLTIN